jgi:hypothetical protein
MKTPEQRGNDQADKMAKKFMNQGQSAQPLPYFTKEEEKFIAFYEDTLIVGNIRTWLKEEETKQLQDKWRTLKVQGRLFRRFPQQIQILTKSIKKWSIERTEGKAWISLYLLCVIGSHLTIEFIHTETIRKKHYATSVRAMSLRPQSIYTLVQLSEMNKMH